VLLNEQNAPNTGAAFRKSVLKLKNYDFHKYFQHILRNERDIFTWEGSENETDRHIGKLKEIASNSCAKFPKLMSCNKIKK
jgi:hypothetical protein